MAAAKGKAKGKAMGSKQTSRSQKAGLTFPVGRIARLLKRGKYASRVGMTAPVYLAAVLEYLVAEILELSAGSCQKHKKTRISPRHVAEAIKNDSELDALTKGCNVLEGGVVPNRVLPSTKKGESQAL